MDVRELQRRVLAKYSMRIEPKMSEYVLRRLKREGGALRELPVIGGDARTGVPTRATIDPSALIEVPAATGTS